jgi:holliday junction DNA helicase RuvA
MISYLRGKILHTGLNYVILETGSGVGYKVLVTPDVLQSIVGDQLEVYTYLKVSDTEQTLFGVKDLKTLEFFELLITVTGVGPKMALVILSSGPVNTLSDAIARGDVALFTRMGGVGKKTAERIILELKNKVGLATETTGSSSDIYDALVALGYSAREVRDAVTKLDTSLSSEEQLKQALKLLSKA